MKKLSLIITLTLCASVAQADWYEKAAGNTPGQACANAVLGAVQQAKDHNSCVLLKPDYQEIQPGVFACIWTIPSVVSDCYRYPSQKVSQ